MQTPDDRDRLTCIFCKGQATFRSDGERGKDYIICDDCQNVYYWTGLPDAAKIAIFRETNTGNAIIWICETCLGDTESLTIGRVLKVKDPCALCGKITKGTDLRAVHNPAYGDKKQ